ncbi:MAG: hypothetical protein AB7G17_10880 [Phycisphaerales bacterium]
MGLDVAIDELVRTGWSGSDPRGCEHSPSTGRVFPGVARVENEFRSAGFTLRLRHLGAFDCWRAEWADAGGNPAGAVVGSTREEAAVYALARVRAASVAVG